MKNWDIKALDVRRHQPQILSSTDDARAIALHLGAGDSLQDHEVHERAWIVVIEGEVEVTTTAGERVAGGPGLLVELAARERHRVDAQSEARLLLVLTPWPGPGHPGAMTIEQKADVRRRAAEKAQK
ncbi:MAG: cupin domain-containing protein [Solirubrobacterales bacterium]